MSTALHIAGAVALLVFSVSSAAAVGIGVLLYLERRKDKHACYTGGPTPEERAAFERAITAAKALAPQPPLADYEAEVADLEQIAGLML